MLGCDSGGFSVPDAVTPSSEGEAGAIVTNEADLNAFPVTGVVPSVLFEGDIMVSSDVADSGRPPDPGHGSLLSPCL